MAHAPVVVYPPTTGGGRRVRVDGAILGIARSPRELREFLRRSGMPDPDDADLLNPQLVEWRGAGPEVWE